jgi:ligand-binding SRPBCC domain-containing protein
MRYRLETRLHLPIPRERVFAFFAAAENLGRITPPELGFQIRTATPIAMAKGTLIEYTIKLWGIPLRWQTRISEWSPPELFVDEQLRGPYKTWIHTHRFTSVDGGTDIQDEVVYELPLGILGRLAVPVVRWQLARIFRFRQEQVARLIV